MAVDDAAITIGALVEIEDGVHAQVREVFAKFVQVFAAEYFFAFFRIGTASHGSRSLSVSLFLRLRLKDFSGNENSASPLHQPTHAPRTEVFEPDGR